MNEIKEVIVFKCRKCENLVCTDKGNVLNILTLECPHCGEEPQDNWILHSQDYWKGEDKEDG